jgi:cardiolipin synthase
MGSLAIFLVIAHSAVVVALTLRVLARRQAAGVAMAWLLFILLAPLLGALLYLMIGERRLGRRWITRAEAQRVVMAQRFAELADVSAVDPALLGTSGEQVARLAGQLGSIPVMSGHRIDLFSEPDPILSGLIDDIDRCQRWCSLEFYIWHRAGRVLDVVNALIRAAERGVKVTALMDGLGSRPFTRSDAAQAMRAAGIEVIVVLPVAAPRMVVARADLRNHRKIAVFDEVVAWTGSFNLADPLEFGRSAGVGPWIDAMVRIEGPACSVLGAMSEAMASLQQGDDHRVPQGVGTVLARSHNGDRESAAGVMLQPFASGPGYALEHVESVLLTAVYAARTELILTTPYFAPGEALLTALCSAARRGVAVTLIVPLRCDSRLVQFASASYFSELLAAGVRIERFNGGLLHTKSMVVDGELSVFGTVNLDLRSFHLNFELSLLIYDRDFAARLRALQHSYLQRCTRLDAVAWNDRGLARRILENAMQLVTPVL